MKNRSLIREEIMKVLFQVILFEKEELEYDLDSLINNHFEIQNEFANEIIYGTITHIEELKNITNTHLNKWTFDRLESTGSAILLVALYEIKYTDTPNLVAINEAIELAKKYSTNDMKNIINAVLDKVINSE